MPKHMVKETTIRIFKRCGLSVFVIGLVLLAFASTSVKAQKVLLPPMQEILAERFLGKSDAPVTLIEYASMTCPYCAAFHAEIFPAIKKEYIETGKVKFVFRNFPLNRIDWAASMMTRCAPKERFFPIVDIILRSQQNWARVADPTAALSQIGLLAGISKETFQACINNKEIFDGMMKASNEGSKKFNVKSTPTFIVNDKRIDGNLPIERFRAILDAELAKAGK